MPFSWLRENGLRLRERENDNMTQTGNLLLLFFLLCAFGLFVGAITPDRKNPLFLSIIAGLAAIVLFWLSGALLISGRPFTAHLWDVAPFGRLTIEIDRLSSLFLCITGLVFFPVSIFSAGYLKRYLGIYSLRTFSVFYHLLFAAIVLTLIAGDIFFFFIGWEAMSILCYFLVNFEHEREKNTSGGLTMLLMSEAGTLAALLAFLIIAGATGGMTFAALRSGAGSLGTAACWAVFLLSFFGFGVKAGLMPVNSWVHRAYPAAPTNISALFVVASNLGLYGMLRINCDILPITNVGQGLIVLIIGTLSALAGILYATPENDMKKMLAHSSVENMGITAAGLGAGFVFFSTGHSMLAGLAFIAALYHMTNHSVYKSLLFLGAGTVDYQLGSRDMDKMGGLIKRMPWTAFFFLVGALSIAALPPFNGFVSEWLTLQTLLQCAVLSSRAVKIVFALCGAGLALTAALAVTCFVKAFGMNFLGKARTREAETVHEARRSMTIPMGILAIACFLLGILPTYVIPVMDQVVRPYVHESATDQLVPPFFTVGKGNAEFPQAFVSDFHKLGAQVGRSMLPGRGLVIMHRGGKRNPVIFAMSPSYTVVALLLLFGAAFIIIRLLTRHRSISRRPAWSGGVRRLLPEMTYSATGFSNPVRVIFSGIFRPILVHEGRKTIHSHFLDAIKREQKEPHLLDRLFGRPIILGGRYLANRLGGMHSGKVNAYAAYVLVTLLVVLLVQALG
jgi:hydrogenase-4 component B